LLAQFTQPQDTSQVTGYLHPLYAASLAEFGTPHELAYCGGWMLERVIPGCHDRDAMGCYPLFCCRDWKLLSFDLAQLENQLISLTLVTKTYLPPLEEYIKYLQRIWESNQLTNNGPLVKELEARLMEFLGVKHLFFVSNGTIALQQEMDFGVPDTVLFLP
jgi:hypothetical protein